MWLPALVNPMNYWLYCSLLEVIRLIVYAGEFNELLPTLTSSETYCPRCVSYCLRWWIQRITTHARKFWDLLSTLRDCLRWIQRITVHAWKFSDLLSTLCELLSTPRWWIQRITVHAGKFLDVLFTRELCWWIQWFDSCIWFMHWECCQPDFLSTRWPTWASPYFRNKTYTSYSIQWFSCDTFCEPKWPRGIYLSTVKSITTHRTYPNIVFWGNKSVDFLSTFLSL